MSEVFFSNAVVKSRPVLYEKGYIKFNIRAGATTLVCVVEEPTLRAALSELQISEMSIVDLKGVYFEELDGTDQPVIIVSQIERSKPFISSTTNATESFLSSSIQGPLATNAESSSAPISRTLISKQRRSNNVEDNDLIADMDPEEENEFDRYMRDSRKRKILEEQRLRSNSFNSDINFENEDKNQAKHSPQRFNDDLYSLSDYDNDPVDNGTMEEDNNKDKCNSLSKRRRQHHSDDISSYYSDDQDDYDDQQANSVMEIDDNHDKNKKPHKLRRGHFNDGIKIYNNHGTNANANKSTMEVDDGYDEQRIIPHERRSNLPGNYFYNLYGRLDVLKRCAPEHTQPQIETLLNLLNHITSMEQEISQDARIYIEKMCEFQSRLKDCYKECPNAPYPLEKNEVELPHWIYESLDNKKKRRHK